MDLKIFSFGSLLVQVVEDDSGCTQPVPDFDVARPLTYRKG